MELLLAHVLHGNTWLKMFMLQLSMVPPEMSCGGPSPWRPPQSPQTSVGKGEGVHLTRTGAWRHIQLIWSNSDSQLEKLRCRGPVSYPWFPSSVRTRVGFLLSLQDSATFLDLLSHYRSMEHSKVDNHHIAFVWFKKYTKNKTYTKWVPSILSLPSHVFLGWAWNHLNIYECVSNTLSHQGKLVLYWSFLWITPKSENSCWQYLKLAHP